MIYTGHKLSEIVGVYMADRAGSVDNQSASAGGNNLRPTSPARATFFFSAVCVLTIAPPRPPQFPATRRSADRRGHRGQREVEAPGGPSPRRTSITTFPATANSDLRAHAVGPEAVDLRSPSACAAVTPKFTPAPTAPGTGAIFTPSRADRCRPPSASGAAPNRPTAPPRYCGP